MFFWRSLFSKSLLQSLNLPPPKSTLIISPATYHNVLAIYRHFNISHVRHSKWNFSSVLVHSLFSQGRSNRRQVTFLGYLYGAVVSFTWSCNSWTNASLSPVKCGERVTKAFTIYTQTKKNEHRS